MVWEKIKIKVTHGLGRVGVVVRECPTLKDFPIYHVAQLREMVFDFSETFQTGALSHHHTHLRPDAFMGEPMSWITTMHGW